MKKIKKALTLSYIEGVIVVTMYDDASFTIINPNGTTNMFGTRTNAAAWFKKTYGATLCF